MIIFPKKSHHDYFSPKNHIMIIFPKKNHIMIIFPKKSHHDFTEEKHYMFFFNCSY